ncbi:PocR ligand-binding domain-containing protein [Acetobacterium wieringae]|uniref:PocR ligand-binding domain-containing protein n=1 Tax=Acetobacterium wieringae TaxID=52694 RepID=UPI0026ED4A1E|nr:PocR ligand-binding domain-containing protein [Acetobacterium wieringae]
MNDVRYQSVLEHAPMGYAYHKIVCDEVGMPCDYEFIEVNLAFERLTGLIGAKILGKRITEVLPEIVNDSFDWIRFYGDIALNGGEKEFEQYTAALNIWCRVVVHSPQKGFFITHFIDITKEKTQLEELNNFFELSLDFLCIADMDGYFVKTNRAWEEVLGYTNEELIRTKYLDFVHPDDVQVTREVMNRLNEQNPVVNFTNRYRAKDGTYHWIEWCSRPQGKLIYAAARDITDRKKIEQRLEKRMLELTRPAEDTSTIDFSELIDLETIQRLQDQFSDATGVASVITMTDGTPITETSNFTRLCRDIIRKTQRGCENCYKSDAAIGAYSVEGPIIKRCLSGGLWDAGAAITVGGKHVASWLIGQVRDENIKESQLVAYAREIGADEEEALGAFREVPRMSIQRFEKIAKLLHTIANQLSNLAFQNLLQARFINEKRQNEKEILYLSYHDYLTGLFNRRYYEQELARLDKKENLPLTLLLGDVNGLKLVNDTLGHLMGDELLIKTARILSQVCRKDDILARLGGDEFIVILPRTAGHIIEDMVAQIKELTAAEKVGGMAVSISFGYETKNNEAEDIEEIFKRAEDDMYRHKQDESTTIRPRLK